MSPYAVIDLEARHHASVRARGMTISLVTTAKRQTIGTLMRATSVMNKITVIRLFRGPQRFHSCSTVSPTGTGRDEDRQRSHSYSESFTDADFRQNS